MRYIIAAFLPLASLLAGCTNNGSIEVSNETTRTTAISYTDTITGRLIETAIMAGEKTYLPKTASFSSMDDPVFTIHGKGVIFPDWKQKRSILKCKNNCRIVFLKDGKIAFNL